MPDSTISREEFLKYVRAFNAHDFKVQHSFYHDDITLDLPDPQTPLLKGSEGIKAHYVPLFEVADEILIPLVVAIDGHNIFYIMESYFTYKKKLPHGVFGHAVEPGDIIKIQVWAHYVVVDGKMKTIVVNLLHDAFLGKANLDEAIEESRNRADPEFRNFE
ncbi:putative SnoaL-like domain-containing protein [Seiridium cardinale]